MLHPAIACTPEELARLQTAFRGDGPEHRVVAEVVQRAAENLSRPLSLPPRGGQHNQWYQCEACQLAASRSILSDRSGGHLFEQTLNEANHMAEQIAPAFDLIHDAPGLTDDDRATIRNGLIVPMPRRSPPKVSAKELSHRTQNLAVGRGRTVRNGCAGGSGFTNDVVRPVSTNGGLTGLRENG